MVKFTARGICFDSYDILPRKRRILLIYEDGGWKPPGGKRNPGESADVCVKREVLEETGLVVCVRRRVRISPFKKTSGKNGYKEILFLVEQRGGTLRQKSKKVGLSPNWFYVSQLPDRIWHYYRNAIERAVLQEESLQGKK